MVAEQNIIAMWAGSVADIPDGWTLCDGTDGTPDLRNRFVVGAGNSFSVDGTGGSETVAISQAELPSHDHDAGTLETTTDGVHTHSNNRVEGQEWRVADSGDDDDDLWYTRDPDGVDGSTTEDASHSHSLSGDLGSTGGGGSHNNMPTFYTVAYIMKT